MSICGFAVPIELIELLESSTTSEASYPNLDWTFSKIRALPGVVRVTADLPNDSDWMGPARGRRMNMSGRMSYHRIRITKVDAPRFDTLVGGIGLAE